MPSLLGITITARKTLFRAGWHFNTRSTGDTRCNQCCGFIKHWVEHCVNYRLTLIACDIPCAMLLTDRVASGEINSTQKRKV